MRQLSLPLLADLFKVEASSCSASIIRQVSSKQAREPTSQLDDERAGERAFELD